MISYFLAATCYGFLFYTFYLLLLKGRSSHTWNRGYLLIITLLVLLLPQVKFDFSNWYTGSVAQTLQAVTLPEVIRTATGDKAAGAWYSGIPVVPLLYYIITAILLVRFLYRIITLYLFLRKHDFIEQDGYRLALNTGIGPASFGSNLLFPTAEINPFILNHEKAHLQYRHHYDRLLLQLLQCFFFPVIPLYFIHKELVLVHEFEADAVAGRDQKNYVQALLSKHLDTRQLYLLQSFFHHPLKRRIMMLQRNYTGKSNRGAKASVLFCSLILLCAIVYGQSMQASKLPEQLLPARVLTMQNKEQPQATGYQETMREEPYNKPVVPEQQYRPVKPQLNEENISGPRTQDVSPIEQIPNVPLQQREPERDIGQKIFTSVEHMPQPLMDLNRYLAEHIRYPEEARKNNIQGRVVLQFVVDKDGSVTNVVLQRDIGGGCGAEALRVVNGMPKWTPGKQAGQAVKVYYTLPVSFRLMEEGRMGNKPPVPDK